MKATHELLYIVTLCWWICPHSIFISLVWGSTWYSQNVKKNKRRMAVHHFSLDGMQSQLVPQNISISDPVMSLYTSECWINTCIGKDSKLAVLVKPRWSSSEYISVFCGPGIKYATWERIFCFFALNVFYLPWFWLFFDIRKVLS